MSDNTRPPIPHDENSHTNKPSGKHQLLFKPVTLFVVIAIAFLATLIFYGASDRKPTDDIVLDPSLAKGAAEKEVAPATETPPAAKQKAVPLDTRTPPKAADDGEKTEEERTQTKETRKQKIKALSDEIYEELKRKEVLTTHTFFLKSREKLDCTITKDMGTHWKIRYKGMTTIIDKDKIESIKSRSPQRVEMELRKMALEQATQIIDNGLVHYDDKWITPEEKKLLIHVAKTEAEIKKLEAQKRAGKPMPRQRAKSSPEKKSVTSGTEGRIDTSAITVVEGFGFGDIVVGHPRCTRGFIKSKLGEPDMEKQHALVYDSRCGMTFITASDMDMLVEIHLKNRFKGRLLSGISFSSTIEDIFEAYGEPIEEKTVDTLQLPPRRFRNRTLYRGDSLGKLEYRDLGVMFFFMDDRITQIVIHRK